MASRKWTWRLARLRRWWRREHVRRVARWALALPLPLLVLGFVVIEITALPRFCVTCHYMEPFYRSWKESSHRDVPCVDCHYPPEVKGMFQRKIQASVQLTKYISRSYGTRPWTEVDDASCLRSGCHSKRLLAGQVRFGGVEFDHTPHLTSFRRVTRLRCTSCHSQIVQGSHITVTAQSCFLCHFKAPQDDPHLSDCQLCHREIRPHDGEDLAARALAAIETDAGRQGKPFEHAPYLERGVDCRFCHTNVVQGSGGVPQSRCLQCHSEPERLARYSDIWFMHYHHVTESKVDCFRCHQEIQHRIAPAEEAAQVNCQTCHPDFHQETRQLYMGQGPGGEQGPPNPMYPPHIPCQGCHVSHQKVDGREVATTASAAGCMLCHGEEYGRDLAEWTARAEGLTSWMGHALASAEQAWKAAKGGAEAGRLLEKAREDYQFVRSGNAVHNVEMAERLLRESARRINRAMEMVGASYRVPPMPRPAALTIEDNRCVECHTDAARLRSPVYGVTFDHRTHVVGQHMVCVGCHVGSNSPQEARHGRMLLTQAQCQQCHANAQKRSPHPAGWQKQHGREARHTSEGCRTCHSQQNCTRCHGIAMPHPPDWATTHSRSVPRGAGVCQKCHTASYCNDCHGLPMPHPANWRPQGHQTAARQQANVCANCHNTTFCDTCHGLRMPHPASWTGQHGSTAEQKPALCTNCHQTPRDCLACHQQKPPRSHTASWRQDHGGQAREADASCSLCHQTRAGASACLSCHGVAMPHPPNWTLEGHRQQAKGIDDAACRNCHQASYCAMCHDEGS